MSSVGSEGVVVFVCCVVDCVVTVGVGVSNFEYLYSCEGVMALEYVWSVEGGHVVLEVDFVDDEFLLFVYDEQLQTRLTEMRFL